MYRIPLVKNIIFLENQHAQEQTYIPIIVFPNPNYGIKTINYNKFPVPIMSSPSTPFYVLQRPFMFLFIGPNTEFYISNRRKFIIDFKNKVNNNIRGQLPLSKQKKRLRGDSSSTTKRHHFEIPITPM